MIKRGLLISAACLSAHAIAGGPSVFAKHNIPVVTLSVGPGWYLPSTTQTIALEPDVIKTYVDDGKTRVLTSAELFFAIQCYAGAQIYSQTGITAGYAGNAALRGDIWEDNNPNFNNYFYRYQINHGRVGIKEKLIGDWGYFVQPYISGSFAVAFNNAFDFTISPKITEEVAAPAFTSNTKTGFAYTVGAGMQVNLTKCWQAGVGYELLELGKSQLGAAAGQLVNQGIRVTHLYAHQLQFSLSYFP